MGKFFFILFCSFSLFLFNTVAAETVVNAKELPDNTLTQKENNVLPRESLSNKVVLSIEEQAWLKKHPVLRIGYDISWSPVEFADEQGHYRGISADYMALIAESLGVVLEPAQPQSWQETLEAIKSGRLDLLTAVSKTPQRTEFLSFTKPYLNFPMVIVTDMDVSYISNIQLLQNKKIAVVQGYVTHDILTNKHPELDLLPVKNIREGTKAVQRGDAYAFVDGFATLSHIMSQSGMGGVKVAGELPYSFELAIGIPKDNPILVGIMQKALDAIPEAKRDEIFNRWVSVFYEKEFDYTRLWQLLGGSLLILSVVLFWNRRLSREVAHRRRVEIALNEAKQAAEAANNAKSQFLANMSHEIRTPMNAIVGMGHLMRQSSLNEQQNNYLDKMHSSSNALLGIIDDILDVSKIESGKFELDSVGFYLDDVLQQISHLFEAQAKQKGLGFHIEINDNVPKSLVGDSQRLTQILINLVANAIKFTVEGEISIVVNLLSQSETSSILEFHIKDMGPGISKKNQQQLFQPFSQVDSSLTRRHGGTGLGLFISQSLAQLMGGKIKLDSKLGRGSTFTLVANFETCFECIPANISARPKPEIPEKVHILLVEDDVLNRLVACELLENMGVLVTTANNGIEAIDALDTTSFNLVFMDLQMPVMDGYEAVLRIREHLKWSKLPIVAMTAHAISDERDKCLQAGMNDYLTKPVEPQQLIHMLVKWAGFHNTKA